MEELSGSPEDFPVFIFHPDSLHYAILKLFGITTAFGCVAHVAEAWIMGTLEQRHKHKISSTVKGNIMGYRLGYRLLLSSSFSFLFFFSFFFFFLFFFFFSGSRGGGRWGPLLIILYEKNYLVSIFLFTYNCFFLFNHYMLHQTFIYVRWNHCIKFLKPISYAFTMSKDTLLFFYHYRALGFCSRVLSSFHTKKFFYSTTFLSDIICLVTRKRRKEYIEIFGLPMIFYKLTLECSHWIDRHTYRGNIMSRLLALRVFLFN